MAKPPGAQRDYSLTGPAIVGGLLLIAIALLAFAFLRPTTSAANAKASAEFVAQMDAAQARDRQKRDLAEKERQGLL